MKTISKFILLLSVLCLARTASAHQPDLSSTILVQQDDNSWALQIRAALSAFEYQIETHFGKDAYATPADFQALVATFTRDRLVVRFNEGQAVILEPATVKLGHETLVTFQLASIPEDISSLEVSNSTFREIPHNQSALLVLKNGFPKEQYTLNDMNAHTAELVVRDSEFVLLSLEQGQIAPWRYLLFGGGLLAFLFLLYVKFESPNRPLAKV